MISHASFLNSAKSQLAKLLATEDLTIRHDPSSETATFDTKSRILTLPVWKNISEDLNDMLIVHEVGHALDTPADGWIESLEEIAIRVHGHKDRKVVYALKGFLNVIEDARIDKRQKRRFPGSKRNYVNGYRELFERDFFGAKGQDVNEFNLIDRINIYFKGGAMSGVKFSAEENDFVKRIAAAETFPEVLTLTEEIYRYCKEHDTTDSSNFDDFDMSSLEDIENLMNDESEGGEGQPGEGSDDGEGEGSGEESDGEGKGSGEESDGGGEGEGSGDGAEEGESKGKGQGNIPSPPKQINTGSTITNVDKNGKGNKGAGSDGTGIMPKDFIPESHTQQAAENKMGSITVKDSKKFVYLGLPKPNLKYIVDDYSVVVPQMYNGILGKSYSPEYESSLWDKAEKFKKGEAQTISYMVKEFETRKAALINSRVAISKTGIINTNKLHSYKYNDDIFKKLSTLPTGKNHGFVMFLDWSGSMSDCIKETLKQLMSLCMFCKRVQIPFEAYFFRELTPHDMHYDNVRDFWKCGKDSLVPRSFKLRNILSSRMNLTTLNKAYFNLVNQGANYYGPDPMGGTPLNEAILAATEIVNQFRSRTKVEIVNTIFLTDGDSNGMSHNYSDWSISANYFIQDEKTKKFYEAGDKGSFGGSVLTGNLLKILKDHTQSNLIGFYLADNGFNYQFRKWIGDQDKSKEDSALKSWNDNKFFPCTTAGYDEYYIIDSRAMRNSTNVLKIDENMTKNKMVKAFVNFSEKKTVNRILLGRFITKISGAEVIHKRA